MVEGEGLLEAVGRDVPRREHRAGVVREHVDARVRLAELPRHPADLVHPRQVGDVLVHGRAVAGGTRLLRSRPYALRVAADEGELGAAPGQLESGGVADASRRAGEDDRRHAVILAYERPARR